MPRPTAVAAAVLVLAGLLGRAPAAWACSCVSEPFRQRYAAADAVFVGTASSVETTTDAGSPVRASFALVEVYKGDVAGSPIVVTAHDEAACGIEFVAGQRYAVFASVSEGVLTAGLCSGTTDDHAVVARSGRTPALVHPALAGSAPVAAARGATSERERRQRAGQIAAALLLLAVSGSGAVVSLRKRFAQARPSR